MTNENQSKNEMLNETSIAENKLEDRTTPESVFESPEDRIAFWEHNREFADGTKLSSAYTKAIKESERIAGVAKFFIIENWQKVKDWNRYDLYLHSAFSKEWFHFHSHSEEMYERIYSNPDIEDWKKTTTKIQEKSSKRRHNPIVEFNEAFLDWDGDFNVTINGRSIAWLDDHSVINLAEHIVRSLSAQNRQKEKI